MPSEDDLNSFDSVVADFDEDEEKQKVELLKEFIPEVEQPEPQVEL